VGRSAIFEAVQKIIKKGITIAAHLMEARPGLHTPQGWANRGAYPLFAGYPQ
jgi:hypothetical protein